MVKNRIIEIFVFFCFVAAVPPAYAESPDYRQLMEYLNRSFPDQYQELATISAKNQDRFVFPRNDLSLANGQELLVLESQADTPAYLLRAIGVLQIENPVDNAYVARQIAAWGEKKPEVGDPVLIPVSPVIYLYSNIKARDGYEPYQNLLREFIRKNYAVVEIDTPEIPAPDNKYGVLLRLEETGHHLTLKLQSLYSGATLFSETQSIVPELPVSDSGDDETPVMAVQSKEAGSFQEVAPEPPRPRLMLPEKFHRLVICQMDDTEDAEFALLSNDKIQIFHLRENALIPAFSYEFKEKNIVGLHLHAMDLTGDGREELMVTLGRVKIVSDFRATEMRSSILSLKENRLVSLAENLPWYLRVIPDRSGKPVLLGQKKGEYVAYTGNIFELRLKEDGGISAGDYPPASKIYSLYQFNLIPEYADNIIVIEPSSFITVYDGSTETIVAATDMHYGGFKIVAYPVPLEAAEYISGFDDKRTFREQFAPRRFLLKPNYDNQVFTINKQRETDWDIKRLKTLISDQEARDSLVAVQWTGQSIRQTWESEKLSKDILDFSFTPGEKRDEIFVLIKDAQGFAVQKID